MVTPFLYRHAYLLIHLLVFLGLLLLLIQPLSWTIQLPIEFWIRQGLLFVIWVYLFYLNANVMVPRLLFQNRINKFVLALLATVVAVVVLEMLISHWLNLPELMHRAFDPEGKSPRTNRFFFNPVLLLTTLLVLGISTSIKVVQKWQKDVELRQGLEKQKISTELSFLKAQINPHFFFNTLHSIYALTHIIIESSREALHTLSRMMRYVLYETQHGTTTLSKEIEFLQDYISLIQLRLTEKVKVEFVKPASYKDLQLAPMLFLPFIENAFKHGVSTLHPSNISIVLQQEDHRLKMEVRNSLLPQKSVVLEESSGIGLVNTRRRLDLIYPEEYELLIIEKTPENDYLVTLTLKLP